MRDKITGYRQRLRKWKKRERAKAKRYAAERREKYEWEEEHVKEVKRLQTFMSVYDDGKDDVVYFSGGALHRRRRFREREMRLDSRNRQEEHQVLKEIRQRLAREGLKNPEAEAQRLYFGKAVEGGLRKQKSRIHAVTHPKIQREPPSQQASSGNGSRKPQASDLAATHPNFGPANTSQKVSSGNSHSARGTTSGSQKPQPPDPVFAHPNFRPDPTYHQARKNSHSGRTTTSGSHKPQPADPTITHPNFKPEPTSQQASRKSSQSSRATTSGLRKHHFLDPALTHPNCRPEAPF